MVLKNLYLKPEKHFIVEIILHMLAYSPWFWPAVTYVVLLCCLCYKHFTYYYFFEWCLFSCSRAMQARKNCSKSDPEDQMHQLRKTPLKSSLNCVCNRSSLLPFDDFFGKEKFSNSGISPWCKKYCLLQLAMNEP